MKIIKVNASQCFIGTGRGLALTSSIAAAGHIPQKDTSLTLAAGRNTRVMLTCSFHTSLPSLLILFILYQLFMFMKKMFVFDSFHS